MAGTATTMQAIALGLDRYDPDLIHRTWLTLEHAEQVEASLAGMTNAERAALPVMAPGRGDVICGSGDPGSRRCDGSIASARSSESDILDGLALEMLDG